MFALSQLPEKFKTGQKSEALAKYIARKYSTYGYRKAIAIEYNPESQDRDRYRWVENTQDGLRLVGKVHDIRKREGFRVEHTGYYIDDDQHETVHGNVYQLPARNGKPVYVPAVADPFNGDAALIDFHSASDDVMDAVRWADGMAERYAEDSRESYAKDAAEQRIEAIDEEISKTYADFKALAKEIRSNCDAVKGLAELRKLIRAEYRRVKTGVHKLRAERTKLQDNFWAAVQ